MRAFLKYSLCLLLALILSLVGYLSFIWYLATDSLPSWSGKLSSPYLSQAVSVKRDEHGIPHVFAENIADALFAQGFLHAQDRLWQMAITRQRMSGRLAEWFGESALKNDKIQAHARTVERAKSHWERFPEKYKPLIRSYVQGINAYMQSEGYQPPPESTILHVAIENWKPEDLFVSYRALYDLLSNPGLEVIKKRTQLFADFDKAEEGIVLRENNVPLIIENPVSHASVDEAIVKSGAFSNNWTVSGDLSNSGKPLMANDPQLGASLPNHWYLMRVVLPNREIVGASMPGFPALGVGHNSEVAWGVTAGAIDSIDVTLAERAANDISLIRFSDNSPWQRLLTKQHVINVRYSEPVVETIVISENGSVIPNNLFAVPINENENYVSIWQWMGYFEETSFAALIDLIDADNVDQAQQALGKFSGPPLNFSLADTSGNIGYILAGLLPKREYTYASEIEFGIGDTNDWNYLDFSENPVIVNPSSKKIISANQQITGSEFPHYLNDNWPSSYRAKRIAQRLSSKNRFSIQDFREMQMDSYSLPAAKLAPVLSAINSNDVIEQQMIDFVRDWDYRFDKNKVAPTIYQTWISALHKLIAEDKFGSKIFRMLHFESSPRIVEYALDGSLSNWCDNQMTKHYESCEEIIISALSLAKTQLIAAYGQDLKSWTWERATKTIHPHIGFSQLPILKDRFSRVQSYSGGPESLMVNSVDNTHSPYFFSSRFTSSFQGLYDLNDLASSSFMISGGVSGHFRSPYYDHFLTLWSEGKRIKINAQSLGFRQQETFDLLPKN